MELKYKEGDTVFVKVYIDAVDEYDTATPYRVMTSDLKTVWVSADCVYDAIPTPTAPAPQFADGDVVEDLSGKRWAVEVDTTKQRYHLSRTNEHGETERRVWTYQVGHEYFTKV